MTWGGGKKPLTTRVRLVPETAQERKYKGMQCWKAYHRPGWDKVMHHFERPHPSRLRASAASPAAALPLAPNRAPGLGALGSSLDPTALLCGPVPCTVMPVSILPLGPEGQNDRAGNTSVIVLRPLPSPPIHNPVLSNPVLELWVNAGLKAQFFCWAEGNGHKTHHSFSADEDCDDGSVQSRIQLQSTIHDECTINGYSRPGKFLGSIVRRIDLSLLVWYACLAMLHDSGIAPQCNKPQLRTHRRTLFTENKKN